MALTLFNLSTAELTGFPKAAKHLKMCSTTYINTRNPVPPEQRLEKNLFSSVELKFFCLIMKKQHPWEMAFIQAIPLDKTGTIWNHSHTKHQCWVFVCN